MNLGSKKRSRSSHAPWFVSIMLVFLSVLGVATAQPASAMSLTAYGNAKSYPMHSGAADPLGEFGEQCVSFADWWEYHFEHKKISHAGNASDWKTWVLHHHGTADHTPTYGAVAWWGHHVAVVDYVGKVWIRVREFNFLHRRGFDTRWIKRTSSQRPLYYLHPSAHP